MPPVKDLAEIRTILQTDPRWAVDALGDLAPDLFERCLWLRSEGESPALLLLYRGFETPVLFALGAAAKVQALLDELGHDSKLYLHVRPEILLALQQRYDIVQTDSMWRMTLDPAAYRPESTAGTVRLGPSDLAKLQRLYADGVPHGEEPHFFLPSMVDEGVYFGIYEGPELIAAAGTHLVVPREGVAAVGCIYTRRDRRGQGRAGRVTSAVVSELMRRGLATVALNVNQQNEPAIRVYKRLGFVPYCSYYEGLAVSRVVPSSCGAVSPLTTHTTTPEN